MSDSIPPALRIAVASDDDTTINLHFGQTETFLVYEAQGDDFTLIDRRALAAYAYEGENARETACRMLVDCRYLLVVKVGVSPKAKLGEVGIIASADYAEQPIATALAAVRALETV